MEGVPVVLAEAMAAGVPVVASRSGGIGEHIIDEVNGRLVNAGDPEDLACAIRATLDDPQTAAHFAQRARELVNDVLSLEAVGARYSQVLADAQAS